MTERLALTQLVEITKSLIAKGDIDGALKTHSAAEAMIAEEPEVKKAYEDVKTANKGLEKLDKELAKRNFHEAKPIGYEYIGGNKYAKYDDDARLVGDKMVTLDKETHKTIKEAEKAQHDATKKFETTIDKRHEESGLSKAVEGNGFLIDYYEPSKTQYAKDHGAQASVSATQAGTEKSNQRMV